jgi:hypothetical protein
MGFVDETGIREYMANRVTKAMTSPAMEGTVKISYA